MLKMVPGFVLGSRGPQRTPEGMRPVLSPLQPCRRAILSILQFTRTNLGPSLYVQVSDFQRMLLDEIASGLDLVTHENRKNLIDARHVFKFDAQ